VKGYSWRASALEREDAKIAAYEENAHDGVMAACESIIQRFGS
jgi:hypothetical protein